MLVDLRERKAFKRPLGHDLTAMSLPRLVSSCLDDDPCLVPPKPVEKQENPD